MAKSGKFKITKEEREKLVTAKSENVECKNQALIRVFNYG